jgi:regulator of replication initiation timing
MASLLVLALYLVLNYLHMTVGTFLDWAIGLAAFWWLIGITTVPWNMYFSAKEVINESEVSTNKGIGISATNIAYAHKLSKRFFTLALALHIISAIGLYLIAYFDITEVGYFAAIAAVLLTFLRPLVRFYDYVVHRLQLMRHEIKYPRDDVYELNKKLAAAEQSIEAYDTLFNFQNETSWVSQQQQHIETLKAKILQLNLELDALKLQNQKDHDRLSRNTADEIAKLSEDAKFLNQVRDLVRFVKNA